jgi:hypothetical protein
VEPRDPVGENILLALRRRSPAAAFVTEVTASLHPAPAPASLERAIDALSRGRRVLLVDHPAPDVHLEGLDLRILAEVPVHDGEVAAQEAADALWSSWLRSFLATHRCQ